MALSLDSTSTFPVDWSVIADAGCPFTHDPMHFPVPVSPLTASTYPAICAGHAAAFRSFNMPERKLEVRVVNHYRYERIVMDVATGVAGSAAQAELVEQTLRRELARQLDRWYVEHRPRLLALHERLRALRPRGRDAATVLALLDEADGIQREGWTIHFLIAPIMTLAMQLLRELHADLFGDDGDGALTLMAGTVSESLTAGFGLADLAQRARDLRLAGAILATPAAALPAMLAESDAGRALLADLDTYLKDHGLRQDLFDLAAPTWREDPTVALATVRTYLETGHDPRADHARVAQAAEAAFEEARTRLATYPGAVWAQFEDLVQVARQGAFLQEEHTFYIDQQLPSLLRYFYLDVGAHLRDLGLLQRPDDVFMLGLDEVRELVRDEAPALLGTETRALVARRREELAQAATMSPPPLIGEPVARPRSPETPLLRALAASFGPRQRAEASGQLRGVPGSRGVASGPARVARTPDEAKAVRPGEVLVATTTMPAWTPLFGVAAAVVTDTGGALSHCAVVAREYGVPAVVGAHGATRAIRTGQLLTVDGSTGLVTIEA